MKPNPVKSKLLAGDVSVGTFLFEFNTPGIGRIMAEAGAEFVVIDMEHTGWSIETVKGIIATLPEGGPVPIVRVPASEYHFIARLLDVGAMGLMFPMVQNGEQAQSIADCSKYPPTGRRGAAFGIAHDGFRPGDILESMQSANRESLIIAQIETREGLQNVDEIAAVSGIDALWIGHFDLTNSLGIPGQFDHPQFQAAVDRVLECCRRHNKIPGFMAADIDDGKSLLARGFRAIGYGGDLWIYQQALCEGIAALRSGR
ncbi:MAG: aldolase [Planctomycetes bacterium]|nr:aldolase [Planctomycetota bacterium]